MRSYRVVFLDHNDHIKKVGLLVCPDDGVAIAEAKKLADGHDVEVWDDGRKVARLRHDE